MAKRHIPGLVAFTVTLVGFDKDLGYARWVTRFLGLGHRVYAFSREKLAAAAREATTIVPAPLGDDAPLLGAAALDRGNG